MGSFFKAIGKFFQRLFSPETTAAISKLIDTALPIVEIIAMATPTRTDDEVIAILKAFQREGLFNPAIPREDVLRKLAVSLLADKVPGTAQRLLNLAIETAYNVYRERQPESASAGA